MNDRSPDSTRRRKRLISRDLGGRYGATMVDEAFLRTFLPKRLGSNNYNRLLNIGGAKDGHSNGSHVVTRKWEKIMLDNFPIKHNFKAGPEDGGQEPENQNLALPPSLNIQGSTERGIRNGLLTVT